MHDQQRQPATGGRDAAQPTKTGGVGVGKSTLVAEEQAKMDASSAPRSPLAAPPPTMVAAQNMVTQIVPKLDDPSIIAQVICVGRPARAHGASMGDHSTAFTTHVEGIRSQLRGKSLTDAIAVLDGMVRALQALPGFPMIEQLPEKERARVDRDRNDLTAVRQRPALSNPQTAEASHLALDLQDYISGYLCFREVIPLSTINVAAKSPALAGKGKGEDASALVEHANGGNVETQRLLDTAVGLFDGKGAALVAGEKDQHLLAKMAPGLDPVTATDDRLEALLTQHVASVATSFPKLFEPASGITHAQLKAVLKVRVTPALLEVWTSDVERYREREAAVGNQRRIATENAVHISKRATAEAARAAAEIAKHGEELSWLAGIIAQIDSEIATIRAALPATPAPAADAKHGKAPDKGAKSDEDTAEVDELDDRKQPLANQLSLGRDGKITNLQSAGRSPSPLPGTMGAHSTAWIVHVDRVRSVVIGKSVREAGAALRSPLLTEAKATRASMGDKFTLDAHHAALLEDAEAKADQAIKAAAAAPNQPALLQLAITELLTYINYLPGATLDSADTGGKTEGRHRGTLQQYETNGIGDAAPLRMSIFGLLDVKAAEEDQRQSLIDHHLELIAKTYPKAYAKAGPAKLKAEAADYLAARDDDDGRTKGKGKRRQPETSAAPEDIAPAKDARTEPFAFNFGAFGGASVVDASRASARGSADAHAPATTASEKPSADASLVI